MKGTILLLFLTLVYSGPSDAKCNLNSDQLLVYEEQILKAAEKNDIKKLAPPLVCILQMQSQNQGIARHLASSFLRPLMGGHVTPGMKKDPRYKAVAQAIEELTLSSSDLVQKSFVAEFSRGDWEYYRLFCEQGRTDFCSVFMPDETRIKNEAPLLAAASLMRLKTAYQVLDGPQRDFIGQKIKNLYLEIPKTDRLKRQFIEQIHQELFESPVPLSWTV